VSVVCCQVESSADGRSLVQRSPTDSGGSECGLDTSIMKRSGANKAVEPQQNCKSLRKRLHTHLMGNADFHKGTADGS
jgi:hypothetical protein